MKFKPHTSAIPRRRTLCRARRITIKLIALCCRAGDPHLPPHSVRQSLVRQVPLQPASHCPPHHRQPSARRKVRHIQLAIAHRCSPARIQTPPVVSAVSHHHKSRPSIINALAIHPHFQHRRLPAPNLRQNRRHVRPVRDRLPAPLGQVVHHLRVVPHRSHQQERPLVRHSHINLPHLKLLDGAHQRLHPIIHPKLARKQILGSQRQVINRHAPSARRTRRHPHRPIAPHHHQQIAPSQYPIQPLRCGLNPCRL